MKRSTWPRGKPIPRFTSYEEEVAFWRHHDFQEDADDRGWEAVRPTQGLELDAAEVQALVEIARRRRVSVKRILAQFIREGIRKAS